MDVRQLLQFVAVADTLHFNRAAVRLNMTQPPAGTPLVMFPRQLASALHDLVTEYLSAQGGLPGIAQEAVQMQTIISLVSAGMRIAMVPASLRELARSDVRYIDLAEDAPCLEIGLAWRADDLTPSLQRFLSIIGELQR